MLRPFDTIQIKKVEKFQSNEIVCYPLLAKRRMYLLAPYLQFFPKKSRVHYRNTIKQSRYYTAPHRCRFRKINPFGLSLRNKLPIERPKLLVLLLLLYATK
jgi:hypothetical protein